MMFMRWRIQTIFESLKTMNKMFDYVMDSLCFETGISNADLHLQMLVQTGFITAIRSRIHKPQRVLLKHKIMFIDKDTNITFKLSLTQAFSQTLTGDFKNNKKCSSTTSSN